MGIHGIVGAMVGRDGEVEMLQPVVEQGVPSIIFSDADRLRSVLLNLYTNAAKYTRRGAILLRVSAVGWER
jgi:signal transduction histidine kinase